MVDVDAGPAPDMLIIRGAPGKHALLALGSLAFVAVGILMLILPPPAQWSAGKALFGGILAALFGLAGLGTTAYAATRPLLLLYPDRLVDVRRRLTVPLAEIREVAVMPSTSGGLTRWLSPQWLLLYVHDPGKYAAVERLSKRCGLSDADLTLDLSLASAADYERAWLFIAERLPAARRLPSAGPVAMDAGSAAQKCMRVRHIEESRFVGFRFPYSERTVVRPGWRGRAAAVCDGA